ncbi:MAG: zinc-ribbon domain-containing protein, partial [Bacteroidota bacterium]
QGIIFKTLFDAAAEVIMLLKKLNGLSYCGSISNSEGDGESFLCRHCGEPVTKKDKYCTQCGASL